MMTEFAATVLVVLQAWKDELKPEEVNTTPLPIIVVPPQWMINARQELSLSDDIDTIWDCKVVVSRDVDHAIMVRHDGKVMRLEEEKHEVV